MVALHGKRCGGRLTAPWASANRLVLGQVKVADKSNELTAIPDLLRVLEREGCLVTLAALGCPTDIAQTLLARGGDAVLAVQENPGPLYPAMKDLFVGYPEANFRAVPPAYPRTVNTGQGRIEIRQCGTLADPHSLDYLRQRGDWAELRSRVLVVAERRLGAQTTRKTRSSIASSIQNRAPLTLHAIRAHGGIENELHGVLDIAFRQDESRVRKDPAPHNFATLRHIARNLLMQEHTAQLGIKAKPLKAGWDEEYLLKILLN